MTDPERIEQALAWFEASGGAIGTSRDKGLVLAAALREARGRSEGLRVALAAYRATLRAGEQESEQLRALGDAALAVSPPADEAKP